MSVAVSVSHMEQPIPDVARDKIISFPGKRSKRVRAGTSKGSQARVWGAGVLDKQPTSSGSDATHEADAEAQLPLHSGGL